MSTEIKHEQAETLEGLQPGQTGVILRVGNEKGPVKRRLVGKTFISGMERTKLLLLKDLFFENKRLDLTVC